MGQLRLDLGEAQIGMLRIQSTTLLPAMLKGVTMSRPTQNTRLISGERSLDSRRCMLRLQLVGLLDSNQMDLGTNSLQKL